jgi:hypothetical protein
LSDAFDFAFDFDPVSVFDLVSAFDFGFASSRCLYPSNAGTTPKPNRKTNFKGVGQECPTYTRRLMHCNLAAGLWPFHQEHQRHHN